MDTTNPEEENANATAQAPLLTAEGGAVSKQTPQNPQAMTGTIEKDEQQIQTQAINPIDESSVFARKPGNDDPYGVPGELALEYIEEQALPKQEDKELFHTPVTSVTQDEFVSIHNKTRRAYQDITGNMMSTKTVIDNYTIAKGNPPTRTKILMEDLLPAQGHKWHIRSALAFKAALIHFKKEHMPITGPTDEKTYRLIVSQARLHENMTRTTSAPHTMGASGYTAPTAT